MNGRIETYIHSDVTTQNKGAAIIRVTCKSEAGAKTEAFQTFSKKAAQLVYGASAKKWADVIEVFPDIELHRQSTEKSIGEPVEVDEMFISTLHEPEPEDHTKMYRLNRMTGVTKPKPGEGQFDLH